jgi:hypothetical protein
VAMLSRSATATTMASVPPRGRSPYSTTNWAALSKSLSSGLITEKAGPCQPGQEVRLNLGAEPGAEQVTDFRDDWTRYQSRRAGRP